MRVRDIWPQVEHWFLRFLFVLECRLKLLAL